VRILAIGNVYPPHHLGGYEIIWQGVMRHAREQGHEVRVLVSDYCRSDALAGSEEPDIHRELDWYWHDHEWRSLGPRQTLRLERHNAAVLDRHLDEFRPDVVSWWPVGGLSLGLIERVRRRELPAVLFVLDPWLAYGPRHDLWMRTWSRLRPAAAVVDRLTGLPTRVEYDAAGSWVYCSRTMREQALATGLTAEHSTILRPGVDTALLDQPCVSAGRPWKWNLLYVGRVVEQKGVETAIESLGLLPEPAQLRIVGEGDQRYRSALERLAERLDLADRVHFDGPRSRAQLPDVYRAADAVVFPVAWEEPWGLVPLEAMALGVPVVATGRGGSGEYLRDRTNSLLFKVGDGAGLAEAITELADDPGLRERLRQGGYETAAQLSEERFNRSALGELLKAPATAPSPP
jgi:glycosyltransferase involved in cell wall biosynthesis